MDEQLSAVTALAQQMEQYALIIRCDNGAGSGGCAKGDVAAGDNFVTSWDEVTGGGDTILWASAPLAERYALAELLGGSFSRLFVAGEDGLVTRDHAGYLCRRYPLELTGGRFQVITLRELARFDTPESRQYVMDQILDAIDDGVIVSDHEGRIVLYNKALEAQEGMKAADTVGKYLWDVYRYDDYKKSEHRSVFHSGVPIKNRYRAHSFEQDMSHFLSYSTYPIVCRGVRLGAFSVCKNETGLQAMLTQTVRQKREFFKRQKELPVKKVYPNGTSYTFAGIVGTSAATEDLIRDAQSIAFLDNSVLIVGETGTGKEVYAQSIHNLSKAEKPFVGVNCAAIPENLFESILFGSAKGAYTGAQDTPGLFEKAGDGTIFLDELNSMPLSLQSKLLRAIQERSVRRVGGLSSIPLRCRFISAVNVDPLELVAGGALRQDLFYRIAAICLYIEPLRNRKADMEALAETFITRCNQHMGKQVTGMSAELRERLYLHSWPGNVREFEHFIENMMVRSKAGSSELTMEDIPLYLRKAMDVAAPPEEAPAGTLPDALGSLERRLILGSLRSTGWNISRSARELGIIRQSLLYRIKRLNIHRED